MNWLALFSYTSCGVFCLAQAMAAEITLEECLERALTGNSAINAYVETREAAEHSEASSKAALYPQLKAKARYTLADQPGKVVIDGNEFGPGIPEQATNLADDQRDSYQAGFNLLQPLYTGGNLSHTYARAKYQVTAAESELQYRKELLLEHVKQSFFASLASGKQIAAAEKTLMAQDALRRVSKELILEGLSNKEDLLAIEAACTAAEARLVLLQNERALLLNTLRRLIGAAPDEIVNPKGELEKVRIVVPFTELLPQDDIARQDIRAKLYQVKQSTEDVTIAESGLYPNVTLQGEYIRQRETSVTHPEVWSAILSAEWNIFDWGKTAAEVRRAAAVSRRHTVDLIELQKDAAVEVETLWRKAQTQLSHLLSIEARVKATEWAFRQSLARRKEGKSRQVDVLTNEALLWREYAEYYGAAAGLHGLIAALERAAGRPLEPVLSRSPLYTLEQFSEYHKIDERADSQSATAEHQVAVSPGTEPPEVAAAVVNKSQSFRRLQFGAFAQKSHAEQLVKKLEMELSNNLKLEVIAEKGLFKVVSGFYKNKEEARLAVQPLGTAGYIIRN